MERETETEMTDTLSITFPDGSQHELTAGSTLLAVAQTLGLDEKRVLAGRSGARWLDVREPLMLDLSVRFVMDSDPDADDVVRHSAEHVLAEAVCTLWPDALVDAGRSDHSEKFQYDFSLSHRLSRTDLPRIEACMTEIIQADEPFIREEITREQAHTLFADNPYKLSRLADIPEAETISVFRHGSFVDLCRGPHVQHAKQIGAIALLDVAGSYFRGDEHNPMLQRITGTAFSTPQQLAAWQQQRQEAERRDHRILGRQLDLFSIDETVGGGLVLWHPRGASVRRQMEDYWRTQHAARGYDFVFTPHIGRAALWHTSGHLEFYREDMFAPMDVDTDPYHCKPMNCPFHAKIYAQHPRSYRELPVRLAELGTVYRYERSGALHGMLRVRGFTQDDSHIFCTAEQAEAEITHVVRFARELLAAYGFDDIQAFIATRPDDAIGDAAQWAHATNALKNAAHAAGLSCAVDPGGGAFYGPKIDIKIRDAIGRAWQLSTIQFDFNLPERFDLSYVGEDNRLHRPLMIHRALYGSIERFFAILVEHYAGAFPLWLAPIQARLLPVTERAHAHCQAAALQLKAAGLRVDVDTTGDKLGAKIRRAQTEKLPYMLIAGDKDVTAGTLSPRLRDGSQLPPLPVADLIEHVRAQSTQTGQNSPDWSQPSQE